MEYTLLVFPRRNVRGWNGHLDELKELELFDVLSEEDDPWEVEWPGDAHCVAYSIPGETVLPRLNKVSFSAIKEQGQHVMLNWMIVDIDNPGHGEWTLELFEETFQALETLPEFEHAGWYLTKHGMRLVWPLAKPISVEIAEDYKAMFHDYLREHGINPDDLFDWTRSYRMPFVLRDGERQEFECDFEHMAPLNWRPPRAPVEGSFSARAAVRPSEAPPEIPPSAAPRRGDYTKLKNYDFYHRIVDGLPLAEPGQRNQVMVKVIGTIIRVYDTTDPYFVYRLMYRSIEAQAQLGSKWNLGALWDRCCYFTSLHAGAKETENELRKAFKAIAMSLRDRAAEAMKVKPSEILHHLIICVGASFYVFNEHTLSYDAPCTRLELLRGLRRSCPALCPTTTNEMGGNLSDAELVARYSTSAKAIQVVMGLEANFYDPITGVMQEGCAQVRDDLEPEFNADVDTWLRLIGADRAEYLLDWLATILKLEQPTCAIYIRGPHSVGKGMLAEGLARLWGGALTTYGALTANFNDKLTQCPLIWADEAIPAGMFDMNASSVFRQLLGSSQMPLKRKFMSEASLMGCPRLLITSNNPDALRVREDLTKEDLDAIIRRVGYIHTTNAPKEFIESLGGREATESWVAGDAIARHVLWLTHNREVKPGPRYLVEGWESELTHDLVTYSGFNGQVLVALVYYVLEQRRNLGIFVGDGYLRVNARALLQEWKSLLGSDARIPEEYKLTNSLRAISHEQVRVRDSRKRHIRCWDIDLDRFYRVAERQNLADRDELERIINATSLKVVS